MLQGKVFVTVLIIVKNGVPMTESSAGAILPAQPYPYPLCGQAREGQ